MSERQTTILDPLELRYLLLDSLKLYSEDAEFISGNNPYAFRLNRKIIYIFIHNVHSSGKGRPNPDECRIQVNRTENFEEAQSKNNPILFFGYYADINIFTAWNPYYFWKRINQKKVVSLYSRFSIQAKASDKGISVYTDQKNQNVISFKPGYLGLYLENFAKIHLLSEPELVELANLSDHSPETEGETAESVELGNESFSIFHKRLKRSPQFRKDVIKAYDYRCAICGIALDLVEAAHIIPHAEDRGNDDIGNGICLCSLHHKAYDNGLVYIDGQYNIKINREKVKYLEKMRLDGGIASFLSLTDETKMHLPSSHIYYPVSAWLALANNIRGVVE